MNYKCVSLVVVGVLAGPVLCVRLVCGRDPLALPPNHLKSAKLNAAPLTAEAIVRWLG